jgi:hypothetical protein
MPVQRRRGRRLSPRCHPATAPDPVVALLSGYRLLPKGTLFATFNDSCRNFAELRAVIAGARDRAQADLSCHTASAALLPDVIPGGLST